jgi:hypothetical protein
MCTGPAPLLPAGSKMKQKVCGLARYPRTHTSLLSQKGSSCCLGERRAYLSTAFRNYANVCDLFRRWRRAPHPPSVPRRAAQRLWPTGRSPSPARGEGCDSMEGSESDRLTLSPRGRGWPALRPRAPYGFRALRRRGLRAAGRAGAFISRGGPGEGSGIRCRICERTYLGCLMQAHELSPLSLGETTQRRSIIRSTRTLRIRQGHGLDRSTAVSTSPVHANSAQQALSRFTTCVDRPLM